MPAGGDPRRVLSQTFGLDAPVPLDRPLWWADRRRWIEAYAGRADEIFVFTPRGEPIFLPHNATVLDFAVKVHQQLGVYCRGALVNGHQSSPGERLACGDICEVLIDQHGAPIDQRLLDLAVTRQAKSRIRNVLQAGSDGAARAAQVIAIDDAIRACGRGPDDPPQLLCGDLNATAASDELRFLRGLHSLAGRRTHFQDAWLRRHDEPGRHAGPAEGITWSSDNHHTRPLRSLDLDRRIDYVFVTTRKKDGRGTVHDCQVVLTERAGDGADAVCASDHYGVCADVQISPG